LAYTFELVEEGQVPPSLSLWLWAIHNDLRHLELYCFKDITFLKRMIPLLERLATRGNSIDWKWVLDNELTPDHIREVAFAIQMTLPEAGYRIVGEGEIDETLRDHLDD
jgi:hypothetical protein